MFDTQGKVRLATPDSPSGNSATNNTLVPLDELLRLTFVLRDLYASALYQLADTGIRHLHSLFDTHYAQQLRLIEVLVDRIGAARDAKNVFAVTSAAGTHPAYVLRGVAPERLLCDLLDAHASVLSAADGARANGLDTSAYRDFAIGRVVLTNDLQSNSVREQLVRLQM
jgi:starvation-inducible DNA-binding protein